MSLPDRGQPGQSGCPFPTRRSFLAAASGLAAGALLDGKKGIASGAPVTEGSAAGAPTVPNTDIGGGVEPFLGAHQGGILTTPQSHTYVATFDFAPSAKRDDVILLLRDWTLAAARMSGGQSAVAMETTPEAPGPDSGEALDLPAARLTITFGFGGGLFSKDGQDRFGLASKRPAAFIDLPRFNGDQLQEARTGGDLLVQACAEDPQVAFHAVRQLARRADGIAQMRWVQSGFIPLQTADRKMPRNLMGFKDGTNNPLTTDPKAMDQFVWADPQGPDWMRGGSYMVVRRIRIALEHWDRMALAFQEQTVGRSKYSGAPLTGKNEFDKADLDATDKDGNSIIPDNAHIRLAGADSNDGARILRRSYSYNDGVNFTSERWPPWRQGMEYDAGLLFVSYQRDPRTGFVKIFDTMSRLDMMNQFVTHTGGGLFACPGGVGEGEYIGQRLFAL